MATGHGVQNDVMDPTLEPDSSGTSPGLERRKGAAELATRISKHLLRKAEAMEAECKHPPCPHAQGLRLAEDDVRHQFVLYINGRP